VIALDFDSPIVDRATRSAAGFQLTQKGTQVGCDGVEPYDDGHGFPLSAFLSTCEGELVLGQQDFSGDASGTATLIQRHFADVAGDRAFQRRSIEQS